jgi:hypothetical protein
MAPLGYLQVNSKIALFDFKPSATRVLRDGRPETASTSDLPAAATQRGVIEFKRSDRIDGLVLVARTALRAGDIDLSDEMVAAARRINAVDARVVQFEQDRTAISRATDGVFAAQTK